MYVLAGEQVEQVVEQVGPALKGLLPKTRLLSYCLKRMQAKPHDEPFAAFLGSMKNRISPESYLGNSPVRFDEGCHGRDQR